MSQKLFLIPFLSLTLTLTSCFLSEGDEWKEKYGTPELLLAHAKSEAYVYLYEDKSQFCTDSGNTIKEALKRVDHYEEIQNRNPTSERYFTYEARWTPATSGPNFEHLSVWDDGLVRIHHKSSLGPHRYLYFSISALEAATLNDLVFSIVEEQNNQ